MEETIQINDHKIEIIYLKCIRGRKIQCPQCKLYFIFLKPRLDEKHTNTPDRKLIVRIDNKRFVRQIRLKTFFSFGLLIKNVFLCHCLFIQTQKISFPILGEFEPISDEDVLKTTRLLSCRDHEPSVRDPDSVSTTLNLLYVIPNPLWINLRLTERHFVPTIKTIFINHQLSLTETVKMRKLYSDYTENNRYLYGGNRGDMKS